MLTGIHFLLSYTCLYECDDCFLYCSPRSKGTFTLKQIEQVLREAKAIDTVDHICVEGGEPFLFYPLLLETVKMANAMGLKTYIETNCYWATSTDNVHTWLKPLQDAGLTALEVSDDSFHCHDADDNPAKRAVDEAAKLGLPISTICISKPEVAVDTDQEKGEPIYLGGPKMRGRAVETLVPGLPRRPYQEFENCPLEDLENPSRVHVDAFGTVHLCQGLSMGNMWDVPLSEMVANWDAMAHPICGPLVRGGPAALAKEHKVEHENTYVDACHCCSALCLKLIDQFPDVLTPKQVYGLE